MKSFHRPRSSEGRHNHLKQTIPEAALMGTEFFCWVYQYFGLPKHKYPHNEEWFDYPEFHRHDDYHGEW